MNSKIEFPPRTQEHIDLLSEKLPLLALFGTCNKFTKTDVLARAQEILINSPHCVEEEKEKVWSIGPKPFSLAFLRAYKHNTCQKCLAMMILIEQHEHQQQEEKEHQLNQKGTLIINTKKQGEQTCTFLDLR